jgi:hypothetical protein
LHKLLCPSEYIRADSKCYRCKTELQMRFFPTADQPVAWHSRIIYFPFLRC